MKPSVFERNLTPASSGWVSSSDIFTGTVVGLHIVHGQVSCALTGWAVVHKRKTNGKTPVFKVTPGRELKPLSRFMIPVIKSA